MEVICQQCQKKIAAKNVNVATDTAFCDACETLTRLSDLIPSGAPKSSKPLAQVSGVHVEDKGYKWSVEARHRSLMALFLVPFTLVWAGGSLSGIYGSQIVSGEFELEQSLFGIPFILGSIVLITLSLMSLYGKTRVSCHNGKATVFIGIGAIGWTRNFGWSDIERVVETGSNYNNQQKHIALEGSKRIGLGWGLSSERLYFLKNFLETKLTP